MNGQPIHFDGAIVDKLNERIDIYIARGLSFDEALVKARASIRKPKRPTKEWTTKEELIIIKNYKSKGAAWCADTLDRTMQSVYAHARELRKDGRLRGPKTKRRKK